MRVNTNSFPDIPNGILTLNGAAVAIYIIVQLIASVDSGRDSRLRLVEAQRNSLAPPDNVQYAVDLAAATLEDYLNRNLSQVKWIFNVAVFVMFCGFAVVCYGASIAMGGRIEASLAVSASGIITQFISVTFMVIYRSTMERANSNVTILARINSIGMAVQVLEKMPDSAAELKNTIRADIVRTLLAESEDTQISPARPRKQVAKPHQPESASAPAE
ncbi:MAG TPA: hypothetical protein VFC15_16005 [Candidatus Limnocylindrales bacterium]|nr:hypothetical protein [Candidatus Limnocylindrales bacterium]